MLGEALARELDAKVGGEVVVIVPEGTVTPSSIMPRMRRFTMSKMFRSNMYEYNQNLTLLNTQNTTQLFQLNNTITNIQLTLTNPLQTPQKIHKLTLKLNNNYYINN